MSRLFRRFRKAGLFLAVMATLAPDVSAQWRERRAVQLDRSGVPVWEMDKEVPADVFTFVRIHYKSSGRRGGYARGGAYSSWITDAPDADLNLDLRLHEMTSLRVYPDLKFIEFNDPEMFNYPFIYIVEPGSWFLDEEDAVILRKYLLGGGFLMLDDFWGEREGLNAAEQLKKVFPERELDELPLEHPIFHSIFNLKAKPQLPSIHVWQRFRVSYEREDAKEPDYRAIFDDKGRMMVVFCHNTDNGDGWEREGEDPEYFQLFSEPMAYPLMINIIFYAMTH
jgi:hypothetical protein